MLADSGAWGVPAAPSSARDGSVRATNRAGASRENQHSESGAGSAKTAATPRQQRATARTGNAEAMPPSPSVQRAVGSTKPEEAARVSLPMAQLQRLGQLAEEVAACTRCGLHQSRTQTVFARGSATAGLVFVGEGPGEEEDRQGQPFVGPAGQLLDRMIAAMQLSRDDVYVCNIVKCRPPRNRKPELEEMNQCMPYLVEQIGLLQPKVIVALGATAAQGLLGTAEGIMRLRGQWKLYRGSIPLMPTFHPAYLLRQPQAKREVWDDLREVMRQLERSRATTSG
jgi:uracil-DNA glycosylase family 4